MSHAPTRRPAALAVMLVCLLVLVGCDRRSDEPDVPPANAASAPDR